MSQDLSKYGGFNSYDLLKAIAIITMIIDHVGCFFYLDMPLFRVFGRAAYVLFAFCIGYNQKYRFDSNLLILAIFMAFGSIILNDKPLIIQHILQTSILFSIIIVRYLMKFIAPIINKKTMFVWFLIAFFLAPITNLLFQYGTAGIAIAICGYLCATKKAEKLYPFFLTLNLITYATIETSNFHFNERAICWMFPVFISLHKLLINFSIFPIKLPEFQSNTLSFLSRYSLIIYFVHYEIFFILTKIIY